MSVAATTAAMVWRAACEPARRRLQSALDDPESTQRQVLARLLEANYGTEFGRSHALSSRLTIGEFQEAVPVRAYDEFSPWIDRAIAGVPAVLTIERIEAFERSSGSTAAAKFIPFTSSFRSELGEAVRAWMGDVFRRHPQTTRGPAWWITSPLRLPREATSGGIPVGLDGDEDYLGWFEKRMAPALWAVPPAIRTAGNWDATLDWTLRFLLQSPDLRLISVWNPSLLEMLWNRFAAEPAHWLSLLAEGRGPGSHDPLERHLQARPRLAAGLMTRLAAGALTPADVWPRLAMVSAWEAADAAPSAAAVRKLFSQATFQPKGLLATEGVVSIPWLDDSEPPVPALRSHFLEFEEGEGGRVRLVHELEEGREYGVILSTGAGFCRLRLGDVVRAHHRCGRTPRLEFLGRSDGVCDLRGEKLNPIMVRHVMEASQNRDAAFLFAMLAPDRGASPPRYVLYLGDGGGPAEARAMGGRVEAALSANPHYAHCRAIGQLAPLQIVLVQGRARESYVRRCVALGQVAGTVKPGALNRHDGWTSWFDSQIMEGAS